MTQNSGKSPSGQPEDTFESDSWTGGPSPEPKKSKLDKWADAHPLRVMAICIVVIAAASTAQLDVRMALSVSQMFTIFALEAAALVLGYASIFGGIWLLAKLAGRMDGREIRGLSSFGRGYLLLLFVVGFFAIAIFGPVFAAKVVGLIGGAL